MSCAHPNNQALYQAILDKIERYPAFERFKIKAYKVLAEKVAALTISVPDMTKDEVQKLFPGAATGTGTGAFIEIYWRLGCDYRDTATHPENQGLYQALMVKAASYSEANQFMSADQFKAKAYYIIALQVKLSFDPFHHQDAQRWGDAAFGWGPRTTAFVKEYLLAH